MDSMCTTDVCPNTAEIFVFFEIAVQYKSFHNRLHKVQNKQLQNNDIIVSHFENYTYSHDLVSFLYTK